MGKWHLLANETHPAEQPKRFTARVLQVIPFIRRWDSALSRVSFLEWHSSSLRRTFSCGDMNRTVLVSVVLAALISKLNVLLTITVKHAQLPWLYYKNYPKENLGCCQHLTPVRIGWKNELCYKSTHGLGHRARRRSWFGLWCFWFQSL